MAKGIKTFNLKKIFKKYFQDVSKALKFSYLLFFPMKGLVTPHIIPAEINPNMTKFSGDVKMSIIKYN